MFSTVTEHFSEEWFEVAVESGACQKDDAPIPGCLSQDLIGPCRDCDEDEDIPPSPTWVLKDSEKSMKGEIAIFNLIVLYRIGFGIASVRIQCTSSARWIACMVDCIHHLTICDASQRKLPYVGQAYFEILGKIAF